jgi:hypothetical protein
MPLLPVGVAPVAAATTAVGALEAGRATRDLVAAGFLPLDFLAEVGLLEGFLPEDLGVLTAGAVGAATCKKIEKIG